MFAMSKPAEREAARRLRAEGIAYKRIAVRLGVSPSSVFAWTSDIELTPEQKERNVSGPGAPWNPEDVRRRAVAWAARCRAKRIDFQEEGREAARRGDPLHRTGCMLYWAEGAKSRNMIKFVNSDPNMISVFRRFLIESLEVDAERICFSINVYTNNGLGIAEIEDHWLGILDLPRACARKHTLNHMPTSSSGRARNKLRYGVCTLVVHNTRLVSTSTALSRSTQASKSPAGPIEWVAWDSNPEPTD